jgi:protocatechuate 3,4-dioxygenase beta subunit
MQRKEFLERGFRTLGFVSVSPLFSACSRAEADKQTDCVLTASETAGPFPTLTPEKKVMTDISSDRAGTSLVMKLTIQNKNKDCSPLPDAVVDVWHCDADGNYSQDGGSGMQSANYQTYDFLRGRQSANDQGTVSFKSIYPGWYSGRAPHIHVHVYSASGKSLLVTQIAFPESISAVVYAQGNYARRGNADTTNAADNVFRDGVSTEMPTVTGNTGAGYELVHTIVVSA